MPVLRDYHIIISHSWDYNNDYLTVKGWLDSSPYFMWHDYSVPLSKPLDVHTKNELKHIFSFDEAGVEKFIKSLKAYGVLKSVKNSNAQLEMSDLVDEDIEITDETAVSGDCLYVFTCM